MRLSKVMGLAVVLVALAVAINALAFKTASVTNSASFTISASKDAALGIDAGTTPGTGFTLSGQNTGAATLTIDDNMQPNSVYTFGQVFKLVNHANSGSITLTGYTATVTGGGATIKLYKAGTSDEIGAGTAITLGVGGSMDVDMEVTVTGAAGAKSASIVINGTN